MLAPRMSSPRSLDRAAPAIGILTLVFCGFVCLAGATRAWAEDPGNHLYDRFQVGAAGSVLWLGSTARIDAKDGSIGTEVDVESDLGFTKNKYQPRFDFRWRPGHRHEIEAGYQFARRTADKTLGQTIEVGDTSFAAGAQVHSIYDSDNAFLTYRYAFMAHERTQLGAALGLGAFFFKFGVDALADITSGGQSGSVQYSSTTSFVGPTLALGLYGRFRSGERWYLSPDIRFLKVSVDRVTARVLEGGFAGRYFVSPKVGLDAGYGIRSFKVDVGPKTEGSSIVNLGVSGQVEYTENQFRLGVVYVP